MQDVCSFAEVRIISVDTLCVAAPCYPPRDGFISFWIQGLAPERQYIVQVARFHGRSQRPQGPFKGPIHGQGS